MSPPPEIASAILTLQWLVVRVRTGRSRSRVRANLKLLRRYTLNEFSVLQEIGERVCSLDAVATRAGGRRRALSVPERSLACLRCMESAGFRCAISGRKIGLTGQVHHGVPPAYGGGWELENLYYLDSIFQLCIHDERCEQTDEITDEEWRKVLWFRQLIADARQQFQARMTRQEEALQSA